MKRKPTYSDISLYKNEVSMIEYYQNMHIKIGKSKIQFCSVLIDPCSYYLEYLKEDSDLKYYNKKISEKQKIIRDLEEKYDFSMVDLVDNKAEIEVAGNGVYDFSLNDLCTIL